MNRAVQTVTLVTVTPRDELVPVRSTVGFRQDDVVQLVTRGEDRRETMRVVRVIAHVALVVDRWEARPGLFGRGAGVEVIGRVPVGKC